MSWPSFSSAPNAKLVAGGTDLALEVTHLHREIETLISVNLVEDMKVCEETDTGSNHWC
ncbi:FAD binding domain-containing protein [Vibrio chagasii]|nr:FAD binding domain-containing protein [Vibrio chagasii]